MKLLCVVPSYWPAFQFGGPVFSLHSLNRSLLETGADVTVYSTNAGIQQEVVANIETVLDGIKVTYFSFSKLLEFGSSTGWQFSKPLTRALKQNVAGFDLVYIASIWNYPTIAASHYCRRFNIPYVISPRGHLYSETMDAKRLKKRIYYKLIVERSLQNSAAIHYTSEDEADKCHDRLQFQNRAIVVHNGIDSEEFGSIPDRNRLFEIFPHMKGKKIILFLGRISWKKGLDILIPAYASLKKSRPDTHLIVAGNDQEGYKKKLKQIIRECGLVGWDRSESQQPQNGSDITFTGYLDGPAKVAALSGSDVFVLPSYSENFANSVLEAMACALPVIVSKKVALSHFVSDRSTGAVVDLNPQDLSATMLRFLDDPELCSTSGIRGRRLVREQFTWQKIGREMACAFQEILRSPGAAIT